MRNIIFVILLCFSTALAAAPDLVLNGNNGVGELKPGTNVVKLININCPVADECQPGEKQLVSNPVNPHAIRHSTDAKVKGYAYCADCHRAGGEAVVGANGNAQTGICSQYNFAYPGIYAYNVMTGNVMTDPVSGSEIVSGGQIAVYDSGITVRCKDCHYPHSTNAKVEDFMIHTGCLDCHEREGSSDR